MISFTMTMIYVHKLLLLLLNRLLLQLILLLLPLVLLLTLDFPLLTQSHDPDLEVWPALCWRHTGCGLDLLVGVFLCVPGL